MSSATYYKINEDTAKTAWEMCHMGTYQAGSSTQEYQASVMQAYALAEAAADRAPERAEEANALANSYAQKLADWYNKQSRIGCMCPSVLISGAGNFPTRKKERQNAAQDAHWKRYEQINGLLDKISKIGTGAEIIKSTDADAASKLRAKVEALETLHADMKKANAYYRRHGTLEGCEGLGEELICDGMSTMVSSSWARVPFPPFALQNNLAKIKSAAGRLTNLEATKDRGTLAREITVAGEVVQVVENTEAMRIQFVFPGKPSDEVRVILKKHAFRWSPKNGAWQRQITPNAKWATKAVIEDLGA